MIYNDIRRPKKEVRIGRTAIGGSNRIAVQSMTNTDTHDFEATYKQIKSLAEVGCDIVRVTVPDEDAAETIKRLKETELDIPIVADIHFDYRIALKCAEYGIDKIRINPGNIGDDDRIRAVADECRRRGIPIRIGVNSGSVEKHILEKHGRASAEALCESALYSIALLEKFDFYDIIISVKSSNSNNVIQANRVLAQKCDYPLHIGVTEAGSAYTGLLKSAVGIGALLNDGIGDTVRVSLTADPVNEIKAARDILKAVGYNESGVTLVSCPTCGRTQIDLIGLVAEFEERQSEIKTDKPITVALMGCAVNGPGEAREADIGIAGGKGEALLIKKGKIMRKISEENLISELIDEINKI